MDMWIRLPALIHKYANVWCKVGWKVLGVFCPGIKRSHAKAELNSVSGAK
jgi:hypothetical protein